MMMYGLKECFGARFPTTTEMDHLMAVRGLLIYYSRRPGASTDAQRKLSEAISEVSVLLERNLDIDIAKCPMAPRELFDYYRDIVSDMWTWLNMLKNLS